KLQRDARHHAHGEIEAEDARPEAGRLVVTFVGRAESQYLEDHDEQSQPHRQLGEQGVVGDREGELNAVPQQRCRPLVSLPRTNRGSWTVRTSRSDHCSPTWTSSASTTCSATNQTCISLVRIPSLTSKSLIPSPSSAAL